MRRVQGLLSEKYHWAPPVVMLSTPADHTTSVTIPIRVVKAKGVLKRDTSSVNSLPPVPWTLSRYFSHFRLKLNPIRNVSMSKVLFDNNHDALFTMWKAPEHPSNITIPNINKVFKVPGHPLPLTGIRCSLLIGCIWTFYDPDLLPQFFARTRPQEPADIYIDLILGPTEENNPAARVTSSNNKTCIYSGRLKIAIPLDRVFLPNPNFEADQKYESIFPHRGFMRLTDD